jgi:hypothetical protein
VPSARHQRSLAALPAAQLPIAGRSYGFPLRGWKIDIRFAIRMRCPATRQIMHHDRTQAAVLA